MELRRLIMHGGGDSEDSLPLDEQFALWTGRDGRMLFLPMAGETDDYGPYEVFIREIYEPLGIQDIEMWTDFPDGEATDLSGFASIYIGGGNTFKLLKMMRESGFDRHLREFISRGGAVFGGSAGAIILGSDIMTCAHLDVNNVSLVDTRGLDVVDGYGVWCHYCPEDDERIHEFMSKYGTPVLASPERGGICADGDRLRAGGYEPSFWFAGSHKQIIKIGDEVPELPVE